MDGDFQFRTLNNLIHQRKIKKQSEAERKRSEGLRLIESLNGAGEGRKDPLELLTHDAWEKVLEKLDSPEDLENAGKASRLFQQILTGARLEKVLFPLVLSIPTLWQQLKSAPNTFQSLRGVSKSLRSTIDKHYISRLDTYGSQYNNPSAHLLSVPSLIFSNSAFDVGRLESLLQDINQSAKSSSFRLYCKSLQVRISVHPGIRDFGEQFQFTKPLLQGISSLLSLIGSQILSFTFQISYIGQAYCSLIPPFQTIQEWLSLLHNLQSLSCEVTWDDRSDVEPPQDFREYELAPDSLRTLNVKLNQRLFYSEGPRELLYFARGILHICRNVKNLSMSTRGYDFMGTRGIRDRIEEMELESLRLESGGMGSLIPMVRLPRSTHSLKRIALIAYRLENHSLRQIFATLETFPLLEEVELVLPKLLYDRSPNCLQLENVKSVKLSLEQMKNINFLINLEKLEELHWIHRRIGEPSLSDQCQRKEQISFGNGLVNLYESNIWDVFPSLQKICVVDEANVSSKVYQRECRQIHKEL